jgi:ribosomal protein S3AE
MVILLKKKSFGIDIPVIDQEIQVLAVNQDAVIGRIMKLDLTRALKGKNLDASILIKKENDKLIGEFIEINILPSFIRKMMRNNISYVEDSFLAKTKDGEITIKPYMLTRKQVHRSVRKALRDKAKEVIIDFVKTRDNREIFYAILTGSLQKEISVILKKIYPLSFCEIRNAKLKR